jgi:hypothetical protein
VAEGEEGAPDLLDRSAGFAETVAGGQVQDADADDGEEDHAGDPGVGCDAAAMDTCQEEGPDQRNDKRENGGEQLGCRGVGVGVIQGHNTNDDGEKNQGNESVRKEQEGFAGQVAHGLVSRDVLFDGHGCSSKGYSKRISTRLLSDYVFGGMCGLINTLRPSLRPYSLLE